MSEKEGKTFPSETSHSAPPNGSSPTVSQSTLTTTPISKPTAESWSKDVQLKLSQYKGRRVGASLVALAASMFVAIVTPIFYQYPATPRATALIIGAIALYVSLAVVRIVVRKPNVSVADRIANGLILAADQLSEEPFNSKPLTGTLRGFYKIVQERIQEYEDIEDELSSERVLVYETLLELRMLAKTLYFKAPEMNQDTRKDLSTNLRIIANHLHINKGIDSNLGQLIHTQTTGIGTIEKSLPTALNSILTVENFRRVPLGVRFIGYSLVLIIALALALPLFGPTDSTTALLIFFAAIVALFEVDRSIRGQ